MMNEPDRYTLITCHVSELAQKIEYANQLKIKWFVRSDFGPRNDAMLYLFFDEEGLQKYLSKEWGNRLDTVTEWVEELKDGKIHDAVFVARILELFGD